MNEDASTKKRMAEVLEQHSKKKVRQIQCQDWATWQQVTAE